MGAFQEGAFERVVGISGCRLQGFVVGVTGELVNTPWFSHTEYHGVSYDGFYSLEGDSLGSEIDCWSGVFRLPDNIQPRDRKVFISFRASPDISMINGDTPIPIHRLPPPTFPVSYSIELGLITKTAATKINNLAAGYVVSYNGTFSDEVVLLGRALGYKITPHRSRTAREGGCWPSQRIVYYEDRYYESYDTFAGDPYEVSRIRADSISFPFNGTSYRGTAFFSYGGTIMLIVRGVAP